LEQSQAELEQSQAQLHQTQAELEQSKFLLRRSQQESEQFRSHWRQTQGELEQCQAQLHKIQQEWEQFQAQLQETQKQVERSQLQQAMQARFERTNAGQTQYALLVWEAWYAYQGGELNKMQESLQESLKCTHLSPTETVNNWLENFGKFGSEHGKPLDTYSLTNSEEWKQLMRQLMMRKPMLLTKGKG
jgi:chromosome segregation ATPase